MKQYYINIKEGEEWNDIFFLKWTPKTYNKKQLKKYF